MRSYVRFEKFVAVARARWPPTENPMMPILFGLIPHSAALLRTVLTALCASICGPIGVSGSGTLGGRGTRYLRMIAVMPLALSQAAIWVPSLSQKRFQ